MGINEEDRGAWERAQVMGRSRRRWSQLAHSAGDNQPAAVSAANESSQPGSASETLPSSSVLVKPTPDEFFIDHGSDQEMRWETLYDRGYLVPNELFYVRNHSPTPRIDAETWKVRVEGPGVERSLEIGYDDLLGIPSVSVIRAIECAGNARTFLGEAYETDIPGTSWKMGAIGVAEWTGAPLGAILARAGLRTSACEVMVEGLDDLKVSRPLPIAKALADDTLLAYAMNGQTLPPDHGFPARLLVPGWAGIFNIKWVGRLYVAETPLYCYWNTEKYVMTGPGFEAEPPARGAPLSAMNTKSAFELPWNASLAPGQRLIRGRSWSARGTIARVEVRFDRDGAWQPARLREPNIAQAWVRWDLEWDARPGQYQLQARATDSTGYTQPVTAPFNDDGYLYDGVIEHPVTVE
ncbi:MAG TPA: sulfite oxidase [Armatimonadota bacterium]|nr:sulfite oxidase [Armatimonadota bacterium]